MRVSAEAKASALRRTEKRSSAGAGVDAFAVARRQPRHRGEAAFQVPVLRPRLTDCLSSPLSLAPVDPARAQAVPGSDQAAH